MAKNLIPDEELFDKEIYIAIGAANDERITEEPRARRVTPSKLKKVKLKNAIQTLSLLFSGAALIISGLTWQESQKSRMISQISTRPILSVVEVRVEPPLYPITSEQDLAKPNGPTRYVVVLRNIGNSPARYIRFHYQIIERDSCGSEEAAQEFYDRLENGLPVIDQLLPAMQEEIAISINWKPEDFESSGEGEILSHFLIDNYLLAGELIYDGEAAERFHQDKWCYQLGDGSPKLPIKPCQKQYRF